MKTDEIAAMAQLVERVLGKDEVISSTLISSSKHPRGRSSPGALVLFGAKSPSKAELAISSSLMKVRSLRALNLETSTGGFTVQLRLAAPNTPEDFFPPGLGFA